LAGFGPTGLHGKKPNCQLSYLSRPETKTYRRVLPKTWGVWLTSHVTNLGLWTFSMMGLIAKPVMMNRTAMPRKVRKGLEGVRGYQGPQSHHPHLSDLVSWPFITKRVLQQIMAIGKHSYIAYPRKHFTELYLMVC
jgi:hypothetical protein